MKTLICCIFVGFCAFMLGGATGYKDGYEDGKVVSEPQIIQTCMAFWFGGDPEALNKAMNNYCKQQRIQSSFKLK